MDAAGKALNEIYGLHRNYDNKDNTLYIILWVIVDTDGHYDEETGILVLETDENPYWEEADLYSSEEVKEFKRANGWVYEYCTK